MTTLKSRLASIIFILIFILLFVAGILQANTINQFSGISLRYNTPISGQTAHRARQYATENSGISYTFWPTFWRECSASLSIGIRTRQTTAILFSGDAMLVWPAEYIAGAAPSAIDRSGIAVSHALAHKLWGSTNIIGMRVYVNDVPRIVRGVFSGETELALLSFHIEDTSQSWTAAELTTSTTHPTRADVENFAISSGLGRPNHILMSGPGAVARLMAFFPLAIPAVYLFAFAIVFIKKHYPKTGAPLLLAGLFLSAILLPAMLESLPAWLIPTRWSDFAFWSMLIGQASDSLHEFLSANPMLRDVQLRLDLLKQAGIFVLATCSGIMVCVRYRAV